MKIYTSLLLLLSGSGVWADETATQLDEIVVSESQDPAYPLLATPVTVLDENALLSKKSSTLGETLKNELGVSNQSFGPGVGAPVIRGQAGPRVRVMSNGLGSNDVSALSPDHAVSTDPLLAERIEIIKGPATLMYGSNAIGGAVNVIDHRIPDRIPDTGSAGAVEQRYNSVSDETSSAFRYDAGQDALAVHVDGFYRQHDNLGIAGQGIDSAKVAISDPSLDIVQNPRGYLANTGASNLSGSAGLSWLLDKGFAGAAINSLSTDYGIAPDGSGDELTHIVVHQQKYDFKSELQQPISGIAQLKTQLGYTDYHHTEITNQQPGAYFDNQTFEARLEAHHQRLGPFTGLLGMQALTGTTQAFEKLDGSPILPKTDNQSVGWFAVENWQHGDFALQFGGRADPTQLMPQGMPTLAFVPLSAALSAKWSINSRHNLTLGLSRAARAPSVQELFTAGYHDATRSYEQGNRQLQLETQYNLDVGYRYQGEAVRLELNGFHVWAEDFIYQHRTGDTVLIDGIQRPILAYDQQNAVLKGYEARLTLPLTEHSVWSELSLFSDYTRAQFVAGGDVPRIPPLRYGMEINLEQAAVAAFIRLSRFEDQPYAGAYETTTAGYCMLDLGLNYRIKSVGSTAYVLFLKANNLLDANARNASSYLRNYAPEAGRGAELGIRVNF